MTIWKCPVSDCNQSMAIGMSIGTPICPVHEVELISSGTLEQTEVSSSTETHISTSVNVGGNLTNTGKIKIYQDGTLNVNKDLLNSGDLIVNDPERIKELLIQTVKTTGSVAELGAVILKKFFGA